MPTYFIRKWREHKGWDRKELLDAISEHKGEGWLSESALKKIEIGQTTRPRPETLDAIASALGKTRRELQYPPKEPQERRSPRKDATGDPQKEFPRLGGMPDPHVPGISDDERERRRQAFGEMDALLRDAFDMPGREGSERHPELAAGTRETNARKEVIAALSSNPTAVIHALLFLAVASETFQTINQHPVDAGAYGSASTLLHRLVSDAIRVGELAWLADEFAGGLIGYQILRDTDAAGLRAYQRAVEAYENVHAPVLNAWAGAGGFWDDLGERSLFAEIAPSFNVFEEMFGARIRAIQERRRAQNQ